MASGNFYGGIESNHYRAYIYWSSTPDPATLKSTVTVTMKFWCDWRINASAAKSWSITCNGTTKSGSYTAGLSGTGTWEITTQTFTVSHTNGVAKSISISGSFGVAATLNGNYYGSIPVSGTANLGTITQVMPTAPTTVSTSAGTVAQTSTSFTISWSGAKNGTFNIAKYRLYYKNGSNYTYVKEIDTTDGATSGSTSVTLSGINSTRGNSTVFYVRAIDTKGNYSGYSSDNASVTLANLPTAPTTVTVSASTVAHTSTSFTISWSGASAGSGSISKYRIYYKTSSSASWSTLKDVTGTSTTATLNGIISTRGSLAYFTVGTINSYSLVSSTGGPSKTVALANLPTAPTTISVSAGTVAQTSTSVTLSWSGASAGSGSISSYRITYTIDNGSSFPTLKSVTTTSTTFTLNGIVSTRGNGARFYVHAVNSYGLESPNGGNGQWVYLAKLPTAPTSLTISNYTPKRNDSITASWSGATAGSGSISNYLVEVRRYKNNAWSSWTTIARPTATSHSWSIVSTYTDLSPNDVVQVRIGARNSYGLDTASYIVSANVTVKGGVVRLNVNGVWKEGITYINVNGVWKEATSVYINSNGVWKESL